MSTWEDKRLTFLRAVALERQVMAFILFFVGLIAGFLILSLLHTTVISKTRDIGTLKSIGGSVHGIMSIFLLNGLLMGLIGSALGTAGGFLITRNINAIEAFLERIVGFSLFPSDIYYLDRIPVDQHPVAEHPGDLRPGGGREPGRQHSAGMECRADGRGGGAAV